MKRSLMFVLASVPGAARTLRYSSINAVCHVKPTVLLSMRVVHSYLSGVSGYRHVMCEVEDEYAEFSGTIVRVAPSTLNLPTRIS